MKVTYTIERQSNNSYSVYQHTETAAGKDTKHIIASASKETTKARLSQITRGRQYKKGVVTSGLEYIL